VLLINETAARTLFPGQDPVGQRIGIGIGYMDWDKGETAEIVGVVGDVKYGSPEEAMRPDAYVPTLAYTSPRGVYLLRTAGDPEALIPAVRRTIQAFDRDLPIYDVKTMEQRVGTALSRMRFGALMLGVFAAIALLLAAVGLYGVMAYSVAQRTRELGIRMALGAGHRDVLRLVVTQGMALALGGLAVGLAAALALTRVLASLLYGVSTTDAPTFTGIAALLAAVSFLASYLPARRATRVDPMVALRVEG
jgi:putative ABC transport system permease protein